MFIKMVVRKLSCSLQLLLEEFGKWLNATVKADIPERNKYFSIVFDEVNRQINAGTYMKVSGQLAPCRISSRTGFVWHTWHLRLLQILSSTYRIRWLLQCTWLMVKLSDKYCKAGSTCVWALQMDGFIRIKNIDFFHMQTSL